MKFCLTNKYCIILLAFLWIEQTDNYYSTICIPLYLISMKKSLALFRRIEKGAVPLFNVCFNFACRVTMVNGELMAYKDLPANA